MSSVAVQLIIGVILIVTLAAIATERIHKTIAAMTGAAFALFVAIIPGSGENGSAIIPNIDELLIFVEPDLLLVIIGITLMVGIAQHTGLFQYITVFLIKKTGINKKKLLITLSLLTMVFAAFLDAYMAILVVGSITLGTCRILNVDAKPYILAEAVFGNLGGTMTRIASPPNLIIGGFFDIDFVTFFVFTSPYVLVCAVTTIFLWLLMFKEDFKKPIDRLRYDQIILIDERTLIVTQRGFIIAIIIFVLTTIGFATAPFIPIHLELGYIAMAGGFAMIALVSPNVEESLKDVEWTIVFFFAGLLIIAGIAEKSGLLLVISRPIEYLLDISVFGGLVSILWMSAMTSSIVDNVPVASVMTEVMSEILEHKTTLSKMPIILSAVIGTNLGGNITPIGSASTVQAVTILEKGRKDKAKIRFFDFLKIGLPVTMVHLIIGSVYILLISLVV